MKDPVDRLRELEANIRFVTVDVTPLMYGYLRMVANEIKSIAEEMEREHRDQADHQASR